MKINSSEHHESDIQKSGLRRGIFFFLNGQTTEMEIKEKLQQRRGKIASAKKGGKKYKNKNHRKFSGGGATE